MDDGSGALGSNKGPETLQFSICFPLCVLTTKVGECCIGIANISTYVNGDWFTAEWGRISWHRLNPRVGLARGECQAAGENDREGLPHDSNCMECKHTHGVFKKRGYTSVPQQQREGGFYVMMVTDYECSKACEYRRDRK